MGRNIEASIQNLEIYIGQLSRQLASQKSGGFNRKTIENPKNESWNSIEFIDILVSTIKDPMSEKKDWVKNEVDKE